MKNVFSVNVTTGESEADRFVAKRVSSELAHKTDEMDNTLLTIQKSSTLPAWILIIAYICGGLALIVAVNFIEAALEKRFETAYNNAGWLIYVGAVCLVLALAVFAYNRYLRKKMESTPAVQSAITDSKNLINRCYEDLGVPADAEIIDIFVEGFKTKNGKAKRMMSMFRYMNIECKIFKDGDNLYLADTGKVYAFPLASFQYIAEVKKNATFNNWNKQEPFNKGYYKQYKVRSNNYGVLFVKPYYSVRLTANSEEYQIVIPGYELPTITKYVNITVTGESK